MSDRFEQGHACVIGVGGDLPSTATDAKGLAKILRDPERCAYPEEQVHLLTEANATRSNILQSLETLAHSTNDESTVLIYFSGHGHQLLKPFKSYFLMPYGYSTEDLGDTAISGSEFVDLLREIPAQKLLVVLDCCHAGGLSDLSDFQATKAPLPPEAQRMFAKGGGRIMIGSSHPEELSYAGEPYSAFTYALMKGLCGEGATKQDGYIRATDLAMYASRIVPTLTSDKQHPVLDIEKADNFALAYYAGGKMQPKGLPIELAAEPRIESKPGELNGQIQTTNIVASGERAIAIGGHVQGSNIISGDGNVVGNNSTIQNVTQKGKYSISIGTAQGITIGDSNIQHNQFGETSDIDPIDQPWKASPSPEKGLESKPETPRVEVPVFFATDRLRQDTTSVKAFYGGRRNSTGQLEYGVAKVSIPEDHRMGEIERPKWWKLELWEDPQKHVVLLDIGVLEQNTFISTLHNSVANSNEPDLILFIHGYNTSFADAAKRTAQIAYDLQFPGPAVLYSWPSEARFEGYTTDENNSEWTTSHFEEFLQLLLTAVGARKVNTIAHSMGNRILMRAMHQLNYANLPKGAAKLRNVIFAAPDIDADMFKQFAKKFNDKAEHLTLYASSKDKALEASKLVHGGYPRAGDSGKNLVIIDGLDTIDASLVDTSLLGHSYFGDNRSIISDIFYLIRHNLPPNQRSGLKSTAVQNLYYWLFQP